MGMDPTRRLPADLVEHARAFTDGTREPVEPKHASTVVLLRDGDGEPGGLEVYLLRRHVDMAFAAGMCVFPGGGVDKRDFDADIGWVGPSAGEWAAAFGCDERMARELVCAAVRETFEESGVLLAGPGAGEVVADTTGDDWEADRVALESREVSLTEFLEKRSLYVFSIDLNLSIDGNALARRAFEERIRATSATSSDVLNAFARDRGGPAALPGAVAARDSMADTYHVLNDELTTSVDDAVHELPVAKVADIQDSLTDLGGGVLRVDGRARLLTDDDATISMLYCGAIRLGFSGAASLRGADGKAEGTVHLATRYETDRSKYRWLSQAQLIGFGKVSVLPLLPEQLKILSLSVDLYSML